MDKIIDPSDGKMAYYSDLLIDGFGLMAEAEDGEEYLIQMPFHLNLSGLSKKISCEKCKQYFFPMNHCEIVSEEGVGTGEPYKIINWDKTATNILKKLEASGFFIDFKKVFKLPIG